MVLEQSVFSQHKRRTDTLITTGLPPIASSATCRTYRLCSHADSYPQPAQTTETPPAARTVILTRPSPASTASTNTEAR
ncbi:hypothetical protein ABZT51_45830 [Streptomyces sp. NPDC005373]|uniref:hypothetical protein n=1 Tax=Streptomyces sp. NPDC005373 TaxID=3156879 RepID=UPI0033A134AE